ncbi:hypothetical protein BVRB_6g152240 isoform A [Beta vulgaris subsp. vulgaris]|uniref:caffeic acid 3-O-methyltransferase isoform X2 n=1 Tax=Beta vulgaris subsp. vulgaris TaxID=3555 RepID=UPI00053F7917|nr:caffeic acid 3-O-methyltransferase isoform X2 [Beta vulgaris subsp. vulgaris]KMT06885.1 hypothetical protein BVRB_6g152240 isoform A [Beta vulgaris subsp. vulgaris]
MASTSETKTNSNLSFLNEHNGEEEETYYAYTMQLITSCSLPMVIKFTIDMGVLQLIHDHQASPNCNGLSPAEIAARVQTQNPDAPVMLDRMLRLLATYSVVKCTIVPTIDGGFERRYSSSPVTKFLVPDDDSVSLAALLNLFIDKVFMESWSKLTDAVLEGGIPFNMVHGMHAFEYPKADARFNEVFNQAMYQTTSVIKKILSKYKGLENIQQLVDVGGGHGHTLGVITSQYPSIKAINFDLPHVIKDALPCNGVAHVGGDMFQSIPKGDAIFMKWILHDWSDERCLKLLKNCYKALPENGKVIVVEAIVADELETNISARVTSSIDIYMMTQNPGGKERTRHEFETLAKAAGFANVNFDCCVYNFWVMEFYK